MGGFYGRIGHVFDDHNLTFYEVKDMFLSLAEGRLPFTEKFDGINIYFSVDPTTKSLLYCRNKGDFGNNGVLFQEFIERYKGTDNEKVFSDFNREVQGLINTMGHGEVNKLFENNVFYNTEIIHPSFNSIVKYNTFKVIIQNTGHRSGLNEGIQFSENLDIFRTHEKDFFLINNIITPESIVNEKLDDFFDNFKSFLLREGMKLSSTIGDFVGKKMAKIAANTGIPVFKQKMLTKKLSGRRGVRINHICSGLSPDKVAEVRRLVDDKRGLLHKTITPLREVVDSYFNILLTTYTPKLQTEGEVRSEGVVFSYKNNSYKLTGAYSELIREKNNQNGASKIAIIPGAFKPPHKGHLQMFEHYASVCDQVYVVVSTGVRKCSAGMEYTIEQTQRVLREFLEVSPLDNVIFIFDDHPHTKIISMINDPGVVKSESVVFVGASSKGADHQKGSYIYADRDDIKLLEAKETNYAIKENLSSTHLRDHITRQEFDKVRFFIPDGLECSKYMEIFGLTEAAEKKTEEIMNHLSSLVETSVTAGVQGPSAPIGGTMVDRKEFLEELKLRESVRSTISKLNESKLLEEQKLRKVIRHLIKEKFSPPPTESTGINVLRGTLKSIITQLEDGYNGLTTEPEQRQSFRAHILVSVENLLAPIEASEQGAQEEAALAQEEVQVDIGSRPEDDPNFISIEDEPEEPEEERPEDKFVALPDEDPTGRNIAKTTFKGIAPQIANSYEQLGNQKDQDTFYEYLLTNLKLYFDKFEDAMAINVEEPTSPSYDEEVEVIDA
jgi:cytidyltransferase-like protein